MKRVRTKKDPGRGAGVGYLHTHEGRDVRMQGGNLGQRHRNLEAGSLIDRSSAERAHHRGLLLRRLELDEAEDARGAAVIAKTEPMHWAVQVAHNWRSPWPRRDGSRL